MSSAHLTTGSVEPPRAEGQLRLYAMKFCPYAQRSRLVLKAKGIPHDIVYINLINKPEWYFKIHSEGKVPALLDGDKVVVESLDVCDYVDEKYPDNPLYPAEPEAKRQDKELIQKIAPLTNVFARILFTNEEKTPKEWAKELLPHLQVDYMLWPWSERAGAIAIRLGAKLPIEEDQKVHLRKWKEAMLAHPVVKEIYNPPEKFYILVEAKHKGTSVDYDSI
ncbi:hypothetical protein NQ318_006612 [Aromia moschata]|uniref:GST N-terminal domain-containing protein n=1 Tax=Aromia moschata TaxID=1265417 RepID=A0AAV8XX33_9CUCU|nr:hypothetical protein NQ318_006612 [Aromia moschata]